MKGKGPITRKEKQVLGLLAEHRTYEDISTNLHISITTLYCHVQSLMIKTGTHKQAHLIKWALDQGYGERVSA